MRKTKAGARETRQGIIEAAERLFFASGVARTALEDIACEAGVTRGAVYWHFANKVDLFMAMVERVPLIQDEMLDPLVVAGHADPLLLLEQIAIEALVCLAADDQRQRVYTILLNCEYQGEMSLALIRQQEATDRLKAHFVSAFGLARSKGLLGPLWEPETAACAFDWMFVGLIIQWLRFGRQFDLVRQGGATVRVLFADFRSGCSAAAAPALEATRAS